jgi:hypothetical protein
VKIIRTISAIITSFLWGILCTNAQDNILYKVSTAIEMIPFTEGYINNSGDTIIPVGKYAYCFTEKFDKIAFVGIKGLPGIYAIDRNENVLFRIRSFDNGPDPFNNGLFRIIENNKTGFANMNGEIIIQPQFDEATPFNNGFAAICFGGKNEKNGDYTFRVGGKWGVINTAGREILPPVYNRILFQENGNVRVQKDGEWQTIDIE